MAMYSLNGNVFIEWQSNQSQIQTSTLKKFRNATIIDYFGFVLEET